jgi:hypothetical protein
MHACGRACVHAASLASRAKAGTVRVVAARRRVLGIPADGQTCGGRWWARVDVGAANHMAAGRCSYLSVRRRWWLADFFFLLLGGGQMEWNGMR